MLGVRLRLSTGILLGKRILLRCILRWRGYRGGLKILFDVGFCDG